MSRKPVKYHVEIAGPNKDFWSPVFGSVGTKTFCEGWVCAMDCLYPSSAHRIIATYADKSIEVVRETKGRARPHTN